MSFDHYRLAAILMLIVALALGLVAMLNVAGAIVGWRTDKRRRRLWTSATLMTLAFVAYSVPLLLWRTLVANGWLYVPAFQQDLDAQAARATASAVVHEGDLAPPFEVTTTEGEVVSLEDLRGKVVLLNFFATDCGPCLQEASHLEQVWRSRARRDDFAMLIVGREETTEAVAAFREEHGLTISMAGDPDRSIYSQYARELIPRTFLIARNGAIAWSATGFVADEAKTIAERIDRELDQPASGGSAGLPAAPAERRPAERTDTAVANASLGETP